MPKAEDKMVKTCDSLLEMAERRMRDEGMEERIKKLSRLYDISRKSDTDSQLSEAMGDTYVKVNKIYPRVRVFVSSIFAKRPTIFCRPGRQQDVDSAKKSELFLNYWVRAKKASREIRLWLTHAGLFHYGCMKLGMGREKNALPWIEAVHPLSVRVDPTTERFDPERGNWMSFRYCRTIAQLRTSNLYDEKDVDALWAEVADKDSDAKEETASVFLWEHYLKQGKRVFVITKPQDMETVLRNEEFTSVVGLPGRFLYFSPSFDRFFPVSVAEQILPQQTEINKLRSQQLIHAERSNRFYAYKKNMIDPVDVPALESDEPLKFVPVNGEGNVRDAIGVVEGANMTADVYQGEMRVENDMMEIWGVGSAQMGGQDRSPSKSATETAIIENNLRMRANDYQEVFEEGLEGVLQGVLSLAQERLSPELQVKITEGMWVPLSKEDIAGNVDVSISFGSTLPTDQQAEWARATEKFAMFKGDMFIDQVKLRRSVLDADPTIKDAGDWIINPMPQPGMAPGMPPGMEPPPGMGMPPPGGEPMLGDPAAAANMAAMESVQNQQQPLSAGSDFRQIAGGF